MDETDRLQRRVDEAAEHIKASEAKLQEIKAKLEALQEATSDNNLLKLVKDDTQSRPALEEPPIEPKQKVYYFFIVSLRCHKN